MVQKQGGWETAPEAMHQGEGCIGFCSNNSKFKPNCQAATQQSRGPCPYKRVLPRQLEAAQHSPSPSMI